MTILPAIRMHAPAAAISIFLLIAGSQAQVAAPVSEARVTVVDPSGAVIADGQVVFKSDANTIASRTGSDGSVVVTLPSGRYSVTASHFGFLKTEIPDFQAAAAEPNTVRVVLQVDPHSVEPCGPCGCGGCSVPLVPTILAIPHLPSEITSDPSSDSNARSATRKVRSRHCLYLWKCSAS